MTRVEMATSVAAVLLAGVGGVNASSGAPDPTRGAADVRTDQAQQPAALERRRRHGKTMVAAGDLCGRCGKTARRARRVDPDVVVTIGDNVSDQGLLAEYRQEYGGGTRPQTRWGRPSLRKITLPGYGNHDCGDYPRKTGSIKQGCDGAVAYFGRDSEFGTDIPGTPGSYHTVVGKWLVVHLNSAGDQGKGRATDAEVSTQRAALKNVLAADSHKCEVVIWHHPRYSSGGSQAHFASWFQTAARRGVDVVLNGHDHTYERFAPMNRRGQRAANGTRQFVVGTGGARLHKYPQTAHNSRALITTRGILKMQLKGSRYNWGFLNEAGRVRDSGSDRCHS